MSIPTFKAWGTGGAGTGAVTPQLPSGWQVGDIFLLFAETAAYHVTIPTGWTFLPYDYVSYGSAGSDVATELTVLWKRAVAGDSAPTVSHSGDHVVARICNIRGCASNGNPVNVVYSDIAYFASTIQMTGVTTTKNDCLVVAAASAPTDTTSTQFSNWTASGLSDFTERADHFVSYGNGGGWGVAMGGKAAKGPTGAITVDVSTISGANPYIVFALLPVDTSMAGLMDVTGRVTPQLTGGEESHMPNSSLAMTGGIAGMNISRVGVTTQDLHQTSDGSLSMSGDVSYSLGSVAILLQWSDDSGDTWNEGRMVTVGGRQKRAVWNRLGNSRDRIYRITVDTPCKVVIIGASLEAVKAGL